MSEDKNFMPERIKLFQTDEIDERADYYHSRLYKAQQSQIAELQQKLEEADKIHTERARKHIDQVRREKDRHINQLKAEFVEFEDIANDAINWISQDFWSEDETESSDPLGKLRARLRAAQQNRAK